MNTSNISINVEASATVSDATKQKDGMLSHSVLSPFQAGKTKIDVLLPEQLRSDALHKVLYVLPVEPHDGRYCGDAMAEIRQHGFHNKYQLICVMPTFSHPPWYADHPSDPYIRQESHFL